MRLIEKVAKSMTEVSAARVAGMYTIDKLPMNGDENFLVLAHAAIEALRTEIKHKLVHDEEGIDEWIEEQLNDAQGWPSAGAFHQDRVIAKGGPRK